jgi:hypothetical protein
MPFAVSMLLPPPIAKIKSHLFFLNTFIPAFTSSISGFGLKSLNLMYSHGSSIQKESKASSHTKRGFFSAKNSNAEKPLNVCCILKTPSIKRI